MKMNRVNLGEIVRQKVEESGLSQAKFAELIGLQRQNVRKTVFEKHGLDTDLLCTICEVLDCNLFDYYRTCNEKDYEPEKKIRAKISIELGTEKQDKTFVFSFGNNKVKVE